MNNKKNIRSVKILNILIVTLIVEKMIQHLLTALFFIINIPGIGTPDIGPFFKINNHIMALLNLIYFIIFVSVYLLKSNKKNTGYY